MDNTLKISTIDTDLYSMKEISIIVTTDVAFDAYCEKKNSQTWKGKAQNDPTLMLK